MIISPHLTMAVQRAWISDQEHPHRERDKRSYPDEARFAEILDIAFRASLTNEEGKPVRGSMTCLSEDELLSLEIPKRRDTPLVLRFSVPRPLDPQILGKLAPATSAGFSSLLISWVEDIPKVWGIIYYSRGLSPLTEIPAGIPESRHFAPDTLTIAISGAGSLLVTRGGSVIGRIEKGEFRPAVPTPFHSGAMGPILNELFEIKTRDSRYLATDQDGFKAGVLFDCLNYLLLQIDRRGGGATIIFVPEESIRSATAFAGFPWKCEGDIELGKLIRARIRYDEEASRSKEAKEAIFRSLFVMKANEELRNRLNGIARLASLDGAVLLTPSFDVLGFGVKLSAPSFPGEVREGPDGFGGGGGLMDFTRFGTRHNSALGFIASVQKAVGFIASTDGPIRGLAKSTEAENITCWPDCRLSMFA